ncbi:Cryptochrome/DNA photolyase class 1, partial [Penicillium chermesinum]
MDAHSGDIQGSHSPSNDPVEFSNGKRRWRRNRVACDNCHSRRVRCDRAFPCQRCLRGALPCKFTRELRKRGRIARSKLSKDPTGQQGAHRMGAPLGARTTSQHPSCLLLISNRQY